MTNIAMVKPRLIYSHDFPSERKLHLYGLNHLQIENFMGQCQTNHSQWSMMIAGRWDIRIGK